MTEVQDHSFHTVFGRNLVAELPTFVHRPYLVITMEDLWPRFAHLFDQHLAGVYFVETLELDALAQAVGRLSICNSVIGLGGGQAVDVAKYVAWTRRLPLFQLPTAMTVDAPFGHRAAVRVGGKVRYLGWAVPEAVYVDYDVIRSAPLPLNRSGVGDILCFHTALYDWKLAHSAGRTERQWPYDGEMAAAASNVLHRVLDHLDDIHAVNDLGIRVLMNALRWAGAAYHNAGWNPRHIEGIEHFFFYTLEFLTGRRFIHGQPVCLGVYIGAVLQENRPDEILAAILRAGVDIRPQAMGVTWSDVEAATWHMPRYVQEAGLWYTAASHLPITAELIARVREAVESAYANA